MPIVLSLASYRPPQYVDGRSNARSSQVSRAGRDGGDVSNGVPRHSGRSRQDREGEMVLEENGRSQG